MAQDWEQQLETYVRLCAAVCVCVCARVGDSLAGVNKYSRKNETCKSIGSLGNEEQSATSARER